MNRLSRVHALPAEMPVRCSQGPII
uniref:Uncharacterized protein n=1 Tax=Anguilla anguilla TaxID=7936 RepID=A0A0E9XZB0_ANGAN